MLKIFGNENGATMSACKSTLKFKKIIPNHNHDISDCYHDSETDQYEQN